MGYLRNESVLSGYYMLLRKFWWNSRILTVQLDLSQFVDGSGSCLSMGTAKAQSSAALKFGDIENTLSF